MRERPILFSAPMAIALLAGRKTQTRRLLKQPRRRDGAQLAPELLQEIGVGHACPYGVPGDRLWVKETWSADDIWDGAAPRAIPEGQPICYEADGATMFCEGVPCPMFGRKRPSIFMRQWMSRLALEVTEVRVERLHDISVEDAKAEGCRGIDGDGHRGFVPPLDQFEALWRDINGHGSWIANPWVWVIGFRRA